MLFKELEDDRGTVSFNTKATEVGNSRALRRNNASVDDSIEPLRGKISRLECLATLSGRPS
jgi:hypothetical protein